MHNETSSANDSSQDQRLDRLEREMIHEETLEMAAFRRLLHGLSEETVDSDPIAKVDAIVERIDRLETEIQRHQAQLGAQRNQQKGTKKERAKRLARNEVLRQIAARTQSARVAPSTSRR